MINILFIGDIVGVAGRKIVSEKIADLRKEYDIDVVIANGENSAHGKGISEKVYKQLLSYGIDIVTMGNHTFSKDCVFDFIDKAEHLVRPLNLEPLEVGFKYVSWKVKGKTLLVYNVLGNVFMSSAEESVFDLSEELLETVKADYYFCDFHGEATSEKIIYAYHFQDRLQAVIGTHTHVQTADERIIGKTAFISDVGMCGVYDSIIGRDIKEAISNMVYQEHTRYKIADGEAIFCGVVVRIDDKEDRAKEIIRIQIRP